MSTHARRAQRYAARRNAGWALEHAVEVQKQLAPIMGVDQSTISRYVNAATDSAVSRTYEVVASLVERGHSAGHIIEGLMAHAQAAAMDLGPETCLACLDVAQDNETLAQQAEDVAQHDVLRGIAKCSDSGASPEDFEALADAITRHDFAIREENARHYVVLYFARGYLATRRAS